MSATTPPPRVSGRRAAGALARLGPGLLVMDADSTLIEQEVIELIAERAGTRERVAAVTARAMRGKLDFATLITCLLSYKYSGPINPTTVFTRNSWNLFANP